MLLETPSDQFTQQPQHVKLVTKLSTDQYTMQLVRTYI
jgi:hypothetical protein